MDFGKDIAPRLNKYFISLDLEKENSIREKLKQKKNIVKFQPRPATFK